MKAIELQAHYIFVLVAGAFILAFFIIVAARLKTGSETRASIQIGTNLASTFTSAAQTPGAALNITFPAKIKYSCSKPCECAFNIGKQKTIIKESVFAPQDYPTTKAVVFSQAWGVPRATNYLYLTSTDYKYYIIHKNDDLVAKNAIDKLPESMRFQAINQISEAKYEGEAKSVFVYLFTTKAGSEPDFGSETSTVLVQDVATSENEFTQVIYLTKTVSSKTAILRNDLSGIIAAMLSQDANVLECNIKKGFARLAQVAAVFEARTRELNADVQNPDCIYTEGIDEITRIKASADILKGKAEPGELTDLSQAQKSLLDINNQLTNDGCPQMY